MTDRDDARFEHTARSDLARELLRLGRTDRASAPLEQRALDVARRAFWEGAADRRRSNEPTTPLTFLFLPGTTETDLPRGVEHGLRVTNQGLALALPRALLRGAVIAVAPNDEIAHRLLGLGVDEVVRRGVGVDEIDLAEQRARLRARARLARDVRSPGSFFGLFERPPQDALLDVAINLQAIERTVPLATTFSQSVESASSASNGTTGAIPQASESTTLPGLVTCDARTVLCAVAERALPALGDSVALRINLPEDTCAVPLSKSDLAEVLAELLRRAAAAVADDPNGGVVTLTLRSDGESAVISVSNTGPVCADADLSKTCPLVNDYVERAGGAVLVELELGVGTTVRVFLPIASETHD